MILKANAEELALIAQEMGAEVITGTVGCIGQKEGET